MSSFCSLILCARIGAEFEDLLTTLHRAVKRQMFAFAATTRGKNDSDDVNA
jgi:hypothetical protein